MKITSTTTFAEVYNELGKARTFNKGENAKLRHDDGELHLKNAKLSTTGEDAKRIRKEKKTEAVKQVKQTLANSLTKCGLNSAAAEEVADGLLNSVAERHEPTEKEIAKAKAKALKAESKKSSNSSATAEADSTPGQKISVKDLYLIHTAKLNKQKLVGYLEGKFAEAGLPKEAAKQLLDSIKPKHGIPGHFTVADLPKITEAVETKLAEGNRWVDDSKKAFKTETDICTDFGAKDAHIAAGIKELRTSGQVDGSPLSRENFNKISLPINLPRVADYFDSKLSGSPYNCAKGTGRQILHDMRLRGEISSDKVTVGDIQKIAATLAKRTIDHDNVVGHFVNQLTLVKGVTPTGMPNQEAKVEVERIIQEKFKGANLTQDHLKVIDAEVKKVGTKHTEWVKNASTEIKKDKTFIKDVGLTDDDLLLVLKDFRRQGIVSPKGAALTERDKTAFRETRLPADSAKAVMNRFEARMTNAQNNMPSGSAERVVTELRLAGKFSGDGLTLNDVKLINKEVNTEIEKWKSSQTTRDTAIQKQAALDSKVLEQKFKQSAPLTPPNGPQSKLTSLLSAATNKQATVVFSESGGTGGLIVSGGIDGGLSSGGAIVKFEKTGQARSVEKCGQFMSGFFAKAKGPQPFSTPRVSVIAVNQGEVIAKGDLQSLGAMMDSQKQNESYVNGKRKGVIDGAIDKVANLVQGDGAVVVMEKANGKQLNRLSLAEKAALVRTEQFPRQIGRSLPMIVAFRLTDHIGAAKSNPSNFMYDIGTGHLSVIDYETSLNEEGIPDHLVGVTDATKERLDPQTAKATGFGSSKGEKAAGEIGELVSSVKTIFASKQAFAQARKDLAEGNGDPALKSAYEAFCGMADTGGDALFAQGESPGLTANEKAQFAEQFLHGLLEGMEYLQTNLDVLRSTVAEINQGNPPDMQDRKHFFSDADLNGFVANVQSLKIQELKRNVV